MRPYPPYPSEDEAPAGPPWVQLLPGQRAAIDESTTEVPVITAGTPTGPAQAEAGTAEQAGTAEAAETAEQVAPAADEDYTPQATDSSEVGMQAQQWAAQAENAQAETAQAETAQPETAQAGTDPVEADPPPALARPAIAVSGGPSPAGRDASLAEAAAAPSRRPGDVAESPIAIWSEDAVTEVRAQWSELQAQFIDDPQSAVDSAKDLVADTVRTLSDRLLAEQSDFDPYRDSDRPDTETMRVAMRRYREFLDRILAL